MMGSAWPTTRCCREVPFTADCRWRSSPARAPTWRQTCGVGRYWFPLQGPPRHQRQQSPKAIAKRSADDERRRQGLPAIATGSAMMGEDRPASTVNTALAALSAAWGGDRVSGCGESRPKRARAVRRSSTTRLADERDDNLGTAVGGFSGRRPAVERAESRENVQSAAAHKRPASAAFQAGQIDPSLE